MSDLGPLSRSHHTVPRFYLRGFAQANQVEVVRLPGERRFTQSVSKASVVKDFYTFESAGSRDDSIEKALSDVESRASDVFKKIQSGQWPLGPDDRMLLGYFIALQAARVPQRRRSTDHVSRQILRLQLGAGGKDGIRSRMQQSGMDVTEETVDAIWDEVTHPDGPPVGHDAGTHLKLMLEVAEESLPYMALHR